MGCLVFNVCDCVVLDRCGTIRNSIDTNQIHMAVPTFVREHGSVDSVAGLFSRFVGLFCMESVCRNLLIHVLGHDVCGSLEYQWRHCQFDDGSFDQHGEYIRRYATVWQTKRGKRYFKEYTSEKSKEKHLYNHKDYKFYDEGRGE